MSDASSRQVAHPGVRGHARKLPGMGSLRRRSAIGSGEHARSLGFEFVTVAAGRPLAAGSNNGTVSCRPVSLAPKFRFPRRTRRSSPQREPNCLLPSCGAPTGRGDAVWRKPIRHRCRHRAGPEGSAVRHPHGGRRRIEAAEKSDPSADARARSAQPWPTGMARRARPTPARPRGCCCPPSCDGDMRP